MRIHRSFGLAIVALMLGAGSAAAAPKSADGQPTRRAAEAPAAWQAGAGQIGSLSLDDMVFEMALGQRSASSKGATRGGEGQGDEHVGSGGGLGSGKFVLGAAGAAGLVLFIDALGGGSHRDLMPLSPVDPPVGGLPPGGNGDHHTVVPPTDSPTNSTGGNPPSNNLLSNNPPSTNNGDTGNGDTGNGGGGNRGGSLVEESNTPQTTTPEPVSMTLLGTGLAALGGANVRRRMRERNAAK